MSIAHLPSRLLDRDGGIETIEGVNAARDNHGVLLPVPPDIDRHLSEHGYRPVYAAPHVRAARDGEPAHFDQRIEEVELLWRYASLSGYDHIRLEEDGEIEPDLPVFARAS